MERAQSILIEKISLRSSSTSGDNSDVLLDILTLVDILLKKDAHAEARLYGRRPLKAYRRMGDAGNSGVERALQLFIRICHAEGNVDEEEACAAVLVSLKDQHASKLVEWK